MIKYCTNCGIMGNNLSCHNHVSYWGVNPLPDSIPSPPPINTELFAEIGRLNVLLNERDKEIERLRGLMPPDERGPGFVGQGSWSVFAEKVVAERDALNEILTGLRQKGIIDGLNRPLPLEGRHGDPTDWRQELKKGDEVKFCLDGMVTVVHRAVPGAPVSEVAVREDVHNRVFHVGTDQIVKKIRGD